MGIFYKEFGLKKILECEGTKSWEEIKVGDTVQLILNLEDYNLTGFKKQVGAFGDLKEDAKAVIGVIPEEEGKLIKDFLDMGWDEVFSAVISQNDSTKPLENRFKVAVYIERFIDVNISVPLKSGQVNVNQTIPEKGKN